MSDYQRPYNHEKKYTVISYNDIENQVVEIGDSAYLVSIEGVKNRKIINYDWPSCRS